MHDFNVSFLHKNIACVEFIILEPLCVQHMCIRNVPKRKLGLCFSGIKMCMNTTVNRFLGNVACPGISFFL